MITLVHLTAVGSDKPSASLEFSERLTVIYGASETGKSYIIDALDFMLGAQALREIPEAAGYSHMLLGLRFAGGDVITLCRNLRGGRIQVYNEDLRTRPTRVPDRDLLGQHNRDNHDNISYFILSELGIADAMIRKNARNEVQAMSLRNIAHLVLVDEGRIQSRLSPVETGIVTARTAERSAFKLLVEGEDDSQLLVGQNPTEFRRVNRGQVEVLDRAIDQVVGQLQSAPERDELLDLLARVNRSVQQLSVSVGAKLSRRDALIARTTDLQSRRRELAERASEAGTVLARFSLLDAQYGSDLERLQMVKEAGTLLGYFEVGVCVFCGADPADQHREHAVYETVELAEAVDAEAAKTSALKADLALTLASVRADRDQAISGALVIESEVAELQGDLDALERELRPTEAELDKLLERRSELERWLGLWTRVSELEELRASVGQEQPETVDPVGHGVALGTLRGFSDSLREILIKWTVPGAEEARFEFDGTPEVILGHRRRADRGKGMRSVLHAGFSVALGEYCVSRELPHPGFLVLDTPVLTYRDAEVITESTQSDEELLSASVADRFYAYLQTESPCQTIILENQTPPEVNADGCSIEFFTGAGGTDRAGFYPV